MKFLIICHSHHHGNTKKIADCIAQELGADIQNPSTFNSEDIKKYDVIGFGSGIYAGCHHSSIIKLVDALPPIEKKVFIFSTRGLSHLLFYHKLLHNHMTRKNLIVIDEFSCPGYSTYGPLKLIGGVNKKRPNEDDMVNARQFAQSIKNKVLTLYN